jgi:hypothetical protein
MLPKFVKVFPHEYMRVLGIQRAPAALAKVQSPAGARGREVLRG